ncbi:Hypothetical predicted protein [Paramuricea clavata]|uniref:Uncharacterized protein n=1 Tax=Paramuricea clavata TaxID=317549 RepID=A0A6S7IDV3_PARCT|nr:Hypothetical predicted protein [Paramuricea clavata]
MASIFTNYWPMLLSKIASVENPAMQKNKKEFSMQLPIVQQQNHISKLAKSLPSLGNTVVPFSTITRHSKSWRAHLERISDFLILGRGVWWTSNEEDATKDTFIPTQTPFLKNQELSDDASNDASMEDEANSEHVGEIAISTPKEHGENCFERVGKNDHSHENIVQYNTIMPMPEDDLRESMLEDTAHMTAVLSYLVQEDVQAVNGTSEAQISKDPLSANKEQWHTKLRSTLAYVLGNTNEVIELDHARKKAKDQRQDRFLLDSYMYKLVVIEKKSVKKKGELEKNIEDWEKTILCPTIGYQHMTN